jgi:hypothetical protein
MCNPGHRGAHKEHILDCLDSISSPGNYDDSVSDTDKAFEWFFTFCEKAGPESCAFYAPDVKQRFNKLLAKLDRGSSLAWFSDTDREPLRS